MAHRPHGFNGPRLRLRCKFFIFQTFHLLAKMMLDERKSMNQSDKMEQVKFANLPRYSSGKANYFSFDSLFKCTAHAHAH